jgi:hypothetical protein
LSVGAFKGVVNTVPGAVEVLGELEGAVDGDAVADGDAEVVGSSVTVFVASGRSGARALLGLSSSREIEQPVTLPTNTVATSRAMTERCRVVGRVVGMASA